MRGLGASALLGLALGCGLLRTHERLTVENHAGSALNGEVVVAGATIWSGTLAPGQSTEVRFQVGADGDFTLKGTLGDGTPVQAGDLGYTTPGDGLEHRLVVGADGAVVYDDGL